MPYLLTLQPSIRTDGAEVIRRAYAQIREEDWATDAGQRRIWTFMGGAIARCTKGWPMRTMGAYRMNTRIEVLGVQAGLVDETDPPKRSMLSVCSMIAPVAGTKDGVVLIAFLDRSFEKELNDSGCLLYLRTESGVRVASILRVTEEPGEFGPVRAFKTKGGLLISGAKYWQGNAPRAAVQYFQRRSDRWACVSAAESDCEAWAPTFTRVGDNISALARGRNHPQNLGVSHAQAQVQYRANFWFDGRQIHAKETRLTTAWSVLDDMAGAIRRKELAEVRRHCSTAVLAKRFTTLLAGLSEVPSVESSGNAPSARDHVFDFRDLNQRFTFDRRDGRWILTKIGRMG